MSKPCPRPHRAAHDRREAAGPDAGFTLVETLVALAIFALSVIAIQQGLATGFRAVAQASEQRAAIAAARSILEAAGIATPLVAGRSTGTTPDGFTYEIEVRPHETDVALLRAATSVPPAFWVTVRTRHVEAAKRPPVEITTLKLGAAR